mgnify:CR=1 FL=1
MVRYLPIVLEIALLIYALIDLLQADQRRIRNLPKLVWMLLVIFIPFLGPLAWFLAGRPTREVGAAPGQYRVYEPPRRPVAPDDDPAFLETLKRKREDEDLLKKWEDDPRRREQEFKGKDADGPTRPDEPDQPKA